ncbi:hypothetical protein M9458_008024, partial [Cirrhinus mrigala]
EVRRHEQATRCVKAISQAKQGQWTRWEGVERRKISWRELMGMEAFHISFILRATYDVLPSPSNLNQWYGEDPTCPLCPSPANLKHILVGCKISLSQGRYTWRHNHVLKCLAATLESRRLKINSLPPSSFHPSYAREFTREGTKTAKVQTISDVGQLGRARDWKLVVDLNQRLHFPSEIATTNLRPDLVLWSSSLHTVYIIELTVPWEDAVEEAFERKSLNNADGNPRFAQWKSAAEASWASQLSGCLRNWECKVKLYAEPSKPYQVQQKKQVDGSGRGGHTWDARCRGPIIETPEKEAKTPILIPLNHHHSKEISSVDALSPLIPQTADRRERPHRACPRLAPCGRRDLAPLVYRSHPSLATEGSMKKIPPESARAGEDDDSLIDYMVIDPGTKQTTRMMITKIPEMTTPTPTPGCKLQICRCGWTKETTYAGLRRHQGLKKCLPSQKQGPCIDRYFLRSCSSKSSEVQQQDQNQSLQNINPPVQEEDEEPSIEVSNLSQPAIENKIQGRKPQVRWPKSCERKEWETIDTDISNLLGQLRGTVVRKLERMGDLIYNYGVERFGMVEKRKKTSPTQTKSRRQQEIERLVKERRQLKKQWRKAPEEEKEGINLLQAEIKNRLATLRRAENLRRRRKKKEQERSNFFKDPYKFAKKLFTKEKNGKLKTSKKDLETYLKQSLTDSQRCGQITLPPEMPPIHSPEHQMDISPPRWSEVKRIVQRARAASSPGPNGVPYRVYKNTPDVLRFLWRLMKVVWQKQAIPTAWRRAGGILIPKEKDSVDISQFRQISLLNVEGKIFFSVVARRLTAYLEKNHFIDTMVQKAGIPGFSGCLEHLNMIWNQIQLAKKDGRDLHVVFLDLANAFGSVPHNLLWTAFHYFSVPEVITRLVKSYFQDLQLCLTTDECTTAWQRVEIGIMAGCTISPLAFTMAMEVIIRASRWVVGGQKLKSGLRLPPIRAYMDDMTILTTTKACARRLLNKLQENIQWARMEIKPS